MIHFPKTCKQNQICALFCLALWTQTILGFLSFCLNIRARFPQPQGTKMYMIHFPRCCEPKQICASFYSALWTQTIFGFYVPQPGFSK